MFTASGDRVVVEGHNKGTAVTTGNVYEHDWVMIFTMRDGQVVRFRHYYDPHCRPPWMGRCKPLGLDV